MSDILWRNAGPDDAATLAAIGRESFIETFGHLYTPENLTAFLEIHEEENWRQELSDPRYAVRLGFVDGINAAYVKLGPPSLPFTPPKDSIELRQFYILKPWQGAGLALAMMDWTLAEARRRGAAHIYLSVFIDNHRARRFYDKQGFEPVGRYDFMVGTHADEDIVMRRAL
ncbi:GNAT family N-acetyltransferase [Sphingosinicella sp.]|uniref:GNAT family N-acetyltransferase n=1 Tax=Sphingosinicella sp. TaxID=1917971 RepID=UPI0040376372